MLSHRMSGAQQRLLMSVAKDEAAKAKVVARRKTPRLQFAPFGMRVLPFQNILFGSPEAART